MSVGSIYKIEFPNGKHYIGLTTTSLEKRKIQHKCNANIGETTCLYNALRKYDIVNTFELIEIDTADTLEKLYEKEIEYIKTYNSHYIDGNGYNMTYGGDGNHGYIFTEEIKEQMSNNRKKYCENNLEWGKEHGEKMKQYYVNNPEAREQMSKIKKQQYIDNPEAREQMSKIKKQHYIDNPEAREQMSEITRKQFENPELRIKHSEIKKIYYKEHPETIQKMLDTMGKNTPFDIFKKDGTFIKTFTYQFEAKQYLQKEYSITSTIKIAEVLNGNRKSSAGFVFKYK